MSVIPYRELTERDNVILNSGTIHISNTINLKQKQAWLYMVYRAFPNISKQRIFSLYQSDLMKAINYKSDNKEHLRTLLRELTDYRVEFNILNKDGSGRWLVTHLLASCEVIENEGIIEYEFSEKLEEKIINPLMYAKLNLLISKNFKSKHALNVYMLALDYIIHKNNFGEKIFTIDELKIYLGLIDHSGNETSKYRVVDIHKHILKKAEKDINEISDMNLIITTVKKPNSKAITGFRFKMSIKEEYLKNYNKSLDITFENKQIELPKNQKKEQIKIENEDLKKFFARHHISVVTETVQEKLRKAKESLGNKFEDYLLFLMKYAEKEAEKGIVKNFSGFFIGLLKDDTQFDNYLFSLEKEKEKEEQRKKKLENMLETELKNKYDNFVNEDFKVYLQDNIDTLEQKFIALIQDTLKPGCFEYDIAILKMNNGKIDKSLIIGARQSVKSTILNHTAKYKDKFGYKAVSFKEWKSKTLNNEYLSNLRKELENKL